MTEQIPTAEELWETLCYLGKWIERGQFCKTVTADEALSIMAHYPGMPWNSRRWDVDHKPARQGADAKTGPVRKHESPTPAGGCAQNNPIEPTEWR